MADSSLSASRVLGTARGFFESTLALFHTRLELFLLELQEEKQRAIYAASLAFVAAGFGSLFTVVATFGIIVIFWDTNRLLAIGIVALVYFLIAVGAGLALVMLFKNRPPMFEASLNEFRKDRAWLRPH